MRQESTHLAEEKGEAGFFDLTVADSLPVNWTDKIIKPLGLMWWLLRCLQLVNIRFYQLPNCNLFTQHVLFIYGETPLVNYGPRSYFHHIAITCLLYSHCLLYLHSLLFSTRYAHNL
jgi:hypothetical protein